MASTGPRDQRPPGRPAVSRWMVAAGVGVLLVAAAITVATVAPWEQGRGARSELRRDGQAGVRSLPGVPLRGPAGLRLLVANDPEPFVLDLDSSVTRPVIGLPADDDRSVHVESVGEDAVVVSRRDCRGSGCDADPLVYLVRHGSTVATRLAAASDVESSRDGRGVWLLDRQDSTHCTLGQVGLDGHPRRLARPVPCESVLIDELPAGLLVYVSGSGSRAGPYSALVTADGAFRRLAQVVDGVAGGDLVLSTVEPGRLVALTDLRSGVSHRLRWPSTLSDHVMGLIDPHPEGGWSAWPFTPPTAAPSRPSTCGCWISPLVTGGSSPTCRCALVPASPR
jgi:hypothetical protein